MRPVRSLFLLALIGAATFPGLAQVAGIEYAIAYSAQMHGLGHVKVMNKQRMQEERSIEGAQAWCLMARFECMGLDDPGAGRMSARDTLRSLHVDDGPEGVGLRGAHFDSTSNTLTTHEFNGMSGSSSVYAFDGAGRLTRVEYAYYGEASGSQGGCTTSYSYEPATHTVITQASRSSVGDDRRTRDVTTRTTWDLTHQYPLEQLVTTSPTEKVRYTFFYRRHCLSRVHVSKMKDGKAAGSYDLSYYFSP